MHTTSKLISITYEKIKNGQISDMDESNKFFKRNCKGKMLDGSQNVLMISTEPLMDPLVPTSEDNLNQQKSNTSGEKSLSKSPGAVEKELEPIEALHDLSLVNDDQNFKLHSPDYKVDENDVLENNLSWEKFELRESENINNNVDSKYRNYLSRDSTKSLFRFLSDDLINKNGCNAKINRVTSNTEFNAESLVKPGNGWEVGVDEFRKSGFRLNPISIDEHIMVPEIVYNKNRECLKRYDLSGGLATERTQRN